MRGGSVSNSRNRSLMVTRSAPGIPNRAGFMPAAMTMCLASRTSLFTSSALAPVKRASPWNVAMPALWKLFSFACGAGSVKVRLNRINSGQSIRNSCAATPLPFIRRTQSTTSAAPTKTFFGSQPRRAHVPPNGRLSIMATLQPAARHRDATVDAAEPVPIQTRSNCCLMIPTVYSLHCVIGITVPAKSE